MPVILRVSHRRWPVPGPVNGRSDSQAARASLRTLPSTRSRRPRPVTVTVAEVDAARLVTVAVSGSDGEARRLDTGMLRVRHTRVDTISGSLKREIKR